MKIPFLSKKHISPRDQDSGALDGYRDSPPAAEAPSASDESLEDAAPGSLLAAIAGLFDSEWYRNQYEDVKRSGIPPINHFILYGLSEGRSPNKYFNVSWFKEAYRDEVGDENPVVFYAREGRHVKYAPSPEFDPKQYIANNPDIGEAGLHPLVHYLRYGESEGRQAFPCVLKAESPLERLLATGLFDWPWLAVPNEFEPRRDFVERYCEGWENGIEPNAFFDSRWYAETYPDFKLDEENPLLHYASVGWRKGYNPSGAFDTVRYLLTHYDVLAAGQDPLLHYLTYGRAEHREIFTVPAAPIVGIRATEPNVLRRDGTARPPAQAQSFALSPSPLVSIIIPNFNGAAHLRDLFESLKAQTYENFEVVFVDDDSTDDSIEIAEHYNVDHVVRTKKNVGFAEANNLALPECSGELIALLNNDMRVDANWLETLVAEVRKNPLIAAAAPKIRFWTKFQLLTIQGPAEFQLDERVLLSSLTYKKHFTAHGDASNGWIRSKPMSGNEAVVLHIPIQIEPITLQLHTAKIQDVFLIASGKGLSIHLSQGANVCEHRFSRAERLEGYYIINNAGSALDANLNPFDRGFGYVDSGDFDSADELDLFCGGAVLIRRDALHGRKLFISELVAYYEDSELSLWLRDQGYKIAYCPHAIVYHKHSATTVEKSAFWLRQTSRNKIIFDYLTAEAGAKRGVIENGKQHLNHLHHWYLSRSDSGEQEVKFALEIPQLYAEIDNIVKRINSGEATRSKALRVGVYNPYWSTFGGGEAHALDIAAALTRFGQVELISQSNFDVASLLDYFGYRNINVRKRIVAAFSADVTRDYDILINSCFLSETCSFAKKSYFLVSFPSRQPPDEFKSSYYFLANSAYTLACMHRLWGKSSFKGEVLYPSIPSPFFVAPGEKQKLRKKIILSVGRFVSTGHVKNQLEIVTAFRGLIATAPGIAEGWRLVLAGTVNDAEYLSKVTEACAGLDVTLASEASFNDLLHFYHEASIYVHASGYGRDPEAHPELFEHFGIAVAQALASGCLPLVFDGGGPKEIIEAAGVGKTWRSLDELVEAMRDAVSLFNLSVAGANDVAKKATEAAEGFSAKRMVDRINSLAL